MSDAKERWLPDHEVGSFVQALLDSTTTELRAQIETLAKERRILRATLDGLDRPEETVVLELAKARMDITALTKELDEARESEGRSIEFCIGLAGHHPDTIKAVFANRDLLKTECDSLRAQLAAVTAEKDEAVKKFAKAAAWNNLTQLQITNLQAIERDQDADIAKMKSEDGGLVDEFLHRFLGEMQRQGIDMGNCDGEDAPEKVLASWLSDRIKCAEQERDSALAERDEANLKSHLQQKGNVLAMEELCRQASEAEACRDSALTENAALREALKRHGEHRSHCNFHKTTKEWNEFGCDCGLTAALATKGVA